MQWGYVISCFWIFSCENARSWTPNHHSIILRSSINDRKTDRATIPFRERATLGNVIGPITSARWMTRWEELEHKLSARLPAVCSSDLIDSLHRYPRYPRKDYFLKTSFEMKTIKSSLSPSYCFYYETTKIMTISYDMNWLLKWHELTPEMAWTDSLDGMYRFLLVW